DSWNAREQGAASKAQWQMLFEGYQKHYPELAQELMRRTQSRLPNDWKMQVQALLQTLNEKKQSVATRKASQLCLDHFAKLLPEMLGGSADLTESNCTNWQGMELFTDKHPQGRYLHYGVREFGMSAIMNGMALYKGIIPF